MTDEQSDDEGNVNGDVLDGPLINDQVVGVEYEAPSEGPEVDPEPPPVKSTKPTPAPAPEPAPEQVEEPPPS